jgi:hypothetical protein
MSLVPKRERVLVMIAAVQQLFGQSNHVETLPEKVF